MANIQQNKSFLKKALSFFNITNTKKSNTNITNQTMLPAEKDRTTGKIKPISMPSDLQQYYQFWLKECHDNAQTLKNRMDRIKDLNYMYYNNTSISSAIELYADEAIQYDAQSQPLLVNAKEKKVTTYIIDFFERIGINRNSLREIARNLAHYGDAFLINSLEEGIGFTSIQVVDVDTVKDRLEFNPITAKKIMMKNRGYVNYLNTDARLRKLADMIVETGGSSDASKYFKPYLFGFQIEDDMFLPPWAVTHFRVLSSKSEFAPFGRPLLINCISPFRQLKAASNLMEMARAAKFPKEMFEVDVDENMTEPEKWNAVNEARQEYQNLAQLEGQKEDFAVGGSIWVASNSIKYTLIQNNMNVDDIADVEYLREEVIVGTSIPKDYLISSRNSWGSSGQALLQQSKMFSRKVLTIQNAILEQLVQMVKLQFIISGDYPEDTDFEISLNFPVVEDTGDRIKSKTETLDLSKSVIDSLSTALGINTKLPLDVVKDIFNKYSFLDPEDINSWTDTIEKENEKLSESEIKKIREKFENISEQLVKEAYFNNKKRLGLNEGLSCGRHYATNRFTNTINNQVLETLKMSVSKEDLESNTNKKTKKRL